MKMELGEETVALFHYCGSIVHVESGKTYYFLPFWFSSDDDKLFNAHSLEKLPKELTKYLNKEREA